MLAPAASCGVLPLLADSKLNVGWVVMLTLGGEGAAGGRREVPAVPDPGAGAGGEARTVEFGPGLTAARRLAAGFSTLAAAALPAEETPLLLAALLPAACALKVSRLAMSRLVLAASRWMNLEYLSSRRRTLHTGTQARASTRASNVG